MSNLFNEPYAALYNRVPHKEVKPGKKQVADFHYIKTIGEGSFAAVLKVTEKSSDREFAMKILEKVCYALSLFYIMSCRQSILQTFESMHN
jgi:hypothetical protein